LELEVHFVLDETTAKKIHMGRRATRTRIPAEC
jgi:hypothetical protein